MTLFANNATVDAEVIHQLGADITELIRDSDVQELCVNAVPANGHCRVLVDRGQGAMTDLGIELPNDVVLRIVRYLASDAGKAIHAGAVNRVLACGARFSATVP